MPSSVRVARRVLWFTVLNTADRSRRMGTDERDWHRGTEGLCHREPSGDHFLSRLCDDFLPSLVPSSQLLMYTTTECDYRYGYTTARRRAYTESLCHQVYSDLLDLLNNHNPLPVRHLTHLDDALARELAGQQELSCILSRLYDVTRPEEEEIKTYLLEEEKLCPLVVGGGPCTGKTVLVAHCCQQVDSWLADQDPVIIPYFASIAINPSPKHFLSCLCYQIACGYRQPGDTTCKLELSQNLPSHLDPNPEPCSAENHQSISNRCSSTDPKPQDPNPPEHRIEQSIPRQYFKPDLSPSWLKDHLSSLLSRLPSPKRPVILMLDGLDQINNIHQQHMVQWLPSPLPPSVKLILSVSNRHAQALQAIRLHYPEYTLSPLPVLNSIVPTEEEQKESDGSLRETGQTQSRGFGFVELKSVEKRQCVRMVASLLSSSGRKVTSGQQTLVNQALSSCSLIFYARLLHSHTLLWTSDSEVVESSLPNDVHASISSLLDLLEQKHGPSLVRHCLSYLTLSRTGLTEAELTDLLSSDDEVLMMEYTLRGEAHPSKLREPHVDVERLLLDLRMFLARRTVAAGTHVLFWVCRHFGLVVTKKYLGCPELRKQLHSVMADYFNGRWALGNAKPLVITREPELSGIKEIGSSDTNAAFSETAQMTVYIDRQLPCQPFLFRSSEPLSSACKEVGLVNLRMILELPYHLQESDRWEELECKLLLSLGFQQAMVQAGLLGDLVAMLEGESRSQVVTLPRERAILASMLKSTACILHSSPQELPMLMETRLLPYVGDYPELEVYIQEIEQERKRRGSSISVVLCPASSTIPSIQCSLSEVIQEQSFITEVTVTACNVVVGVMESGSAWMWRSPWREVEQLSLSNKQLKVKFSQVRSTGRRILLSTYCHMVFLLDVTSPETFVEVQGLLKTEFQDETDQHTHIIEGCVESKENLCVWWKDNRFVCVFHGAKDKPLTFQCQSSVTCLVCSTDGHYMYCGQETGAVALFDINNTKPIRECSNPNQNAILALILCEEQWDVACVDITGNITLWNVNGKHSRPAFLRECCSGKSGNSILNMDFSYELATLLVCEAQEITVWNTHEWVMWGQFMAPQEKAFIQALLAQEGHLFLALLQSCSLVLVWKISSGECVLSLDTSSSTSVPRLLKTASGFITITPDGCLSRWDSEVIYAAGMPPKMSSGVRQVVVDEVGERFYTVDSSVTVWGWSLRRGEPEVNFFHDGPVENLKLSPDNRHLVAVSGGDIYIWQIDVCQNSFRISGSGATDILIAPNSTFAVSLCERGISRVWNLQNGSVACHIHPYLADAKVSPESTFLIGLHRGDLLATSLWSGTVSKRFSRAEKSELVVAFQMLPQQPDFVLVMGSCGGVYTWKVTEETTLRQFQLPRSFSGQLQISQTCSAGSFVLLSTDSNTVAFLDLSTHRICSVKVEGAVFAVCLDKAGRYAACLSQPSALTEQCFCDVHLRAVLTVIRLADGGQVGALRLGKMPSSLAVCEQLCVYVGCHDGSVCVYSILDIVTKQKCSVRGNLIGWRNQCLCSTAPIRLLPLAFPNIAWS
ncbi:NACHT and WD repeat domain-containing protein 2 [Merluccius polli]|uniref:NACHT and WD repeat domain-containing protein 2 n=1 Tax=Merluccius polli TaxID=89951 RepID=A0AA47NZL1_MERPO|nr:NACHT and WD repeat domain-containing protein 2 [Merluccius polli]